LLYLSWQLLIFGKDTLRNYFRINEKPVAHFYPDQVLRDLARILIIEIAKVSAPKSKKNAPAGESENQRPKRSKAKLIRLDDLIPKKDVTGGQRLLFGVSETTQSINKLTKDN
jgi:hypothetical protein